jgi:sigma-B regulation protein RsbU (phosphoserine phosphatase)
MGRRLLLVEDSSTMRRMISALLQDEGYEVAMAVDGRDGLVKARENPPELVISDYEMPELDGPGFCAAFKADPEFRAIPIIMLTTLGATESKIIGLNAGADDYLVKPRSPQEIEELYARIRAQLRIADLMKELAVRNTLLEAAQARFELELKLARKVQMGLMPKPPAPRGKLKIAVQYTPANALGGDVYDFRTLDDDKLGILVADISGHGVNAALLSGMVKTLAAPLTATTANPGDVLSGLDTAVEQYFPEGFFCTGFYAIVDESNGSLVYAGVGHPPGLIVGPHGSRQLDSENGLLGIGLVDSTAGGTDHLAPGESLLLYTDGLPDAMNPADVLFGQDRILVVLESKKTASPAEIIAAIEEAVERHVTPGQPHDDINLVLIQNPLA